MSWGPEYAPRKMASRQELPEYRGWKVWDNGEAHHPAGARFGAIRMGLSVSGYTLEQLKKIIDSRILQYPGSGGA